MNWEAIGKALDPALICRRYQVESLTFTGGHFKYYWLLRNARADYEDRVHRRDGRWIFLHDTFTNRRLQETSFHEADYESLSAS